MANSGTGKMKTALAVLVVVGIADLALLNLYAAPRYVADQEALGGDSSPSGPVARLGPSNEPRTGHPTSPREEPETMASGEPSAEPTEEPAEEPTAEPEPTEAPPEAEPPVASAERPSIPDLTFGTGASSLEKRSKDLLFQVAKYMRATPGHKVLLQGHADSRGPDALNAELSTQRARAAAAYLIELGVAKSRIQITGAGETMPADRGGSAASLARNRRVVVVWQ